MTKGLGYHMLGQSSATAKFDNSRCPKCTERLASSVVRFFRLTGQLVQAHSARADLMPS